MLPAPRLATQGLLGNQAVGARGTGMHLVINQVVQLEDMHVADRHLTLEGFAGATVEQLDLPVAGQPGQLQHGLDFRLVGAVEHRGGKGYTALQVAGKFDDFLLGKTVDVHAAPRGVVDLVQKLANFRGGGLLPQHFANF